MLALLLLASALSCWPRPVRQEQDFNISCFYCHMNVIVEMKVKAPKHWNAGVKCEACHGASMEHIDVEDNSVKPDKVWNNGNVNELCSGCHDAAFAVYRESAHARSFLSAAQNASRGAVCSSCHGYHGFILGQEMVKTCKACHSRMPEGTKGRVRSTDSSGSQRNCIACHSHHSLRSRPSR
jgi:hypothetical protein